MCGIFGITIAKNSKENYDIKRMTSLLFKLSESRGKEAAGLALIDGNEIHVYKDTISASKFIKTDIYKSLFSGGFASVSTVIGHARLVTNGRFGVNFNNQPIARDGIIGVHNGIVVNDAELWKKFPDLQRMYEVDTEVIMALIMNIGIQDTFNNIEGTASIATIFQKYNQLALATNNGSLFYWHDKDLFVFASEQHILEEFADHDLVKTMAIKDIKQLIPQTALFISLENLDIKKMNLKNNNEKIVFENNSVSRSIVDHSKYENTSYNISSSTHSDIEKVLENNSAKIDSLKRCAMCILPETMPFIDFDENDVCAYCRNHTKLKLMNKHDLANEISEKIKTNKKTNCLIPLSGGRDSSFALHYVKNELKLNPVAYSYDWGMLTDLGRRNQARMCGALGIEHIIISADIAKKRSNIHKNVSAWLNKPDLCTVPLFMAGDKQYFYYLNKLRKQLKLNLVFYSENHFEKSDFKSGFCDVSPNSKTTHAYNMAVFKKIQLASKYGKKILTNPKYINSSLFDSFGAFASSYFVPHDYVYLFQFIKWDENEINKVLINNYNWEIDPEISSTWRIGDGTAAFYNYIYLTVAGFNEFDTFRSRQIREGMLTRQEAIELTQKEHTHRPKSLAWYGETIGLDMVEAIKIINKIPKLY